MKSVELIQKMREQTEKELNEESLYTVKSECFICHSICNPSRDFGYYQIHGNCCMRCNANAGRKSNSSKERHRSLKEMERWFKEKTAQ